MARALDHEERCTPPSSAEPYGIAPRDFKRVAGRLERLLLHPLVQELPPFLRGAALDGIADAVAAWPKPPRRRGRPRSPDPTTWRMRSVRREGLGPMKAAEVVAAERKENIHTIYLRWLRRPRTAFSD